MAGDKPASNHAEHNSHEHEAVLTGVMALANLYSNCVEAFGLIHPGPKWEKDEQLLLCRLGLQQARLLTWGDVVGISSPPASVTDRAVPKHPSAAYPDLKEPTFFGPRDPRLDETETRQKIEGALSDIVDRSSNTNREKMMAEYGLKPPKRFANDYHATLDTNRLEGFRERYELLKEVAETYAQISSRRNSSLTQTTWNIADHHKFGSFIKLAQERVDLLINLLDVKERVDRAVRMDIKALGWHLSVDRKRMAMDISKLRMIAESCKDEYPEYLDATTAALDNIDRERRENVVGYNPYQSPMTAPLTTSHVSPTARRGSTPFIHAAHSHTNGSSGTNGAHATKEKKPSIFNSLFKSFNHRKHHDTGSGPPRAQSVSHAPTQPKEDVDPPRSLSDTGPVRSSSTSTPSSPSNPADSMADSMEPLAPKSPEPLETEKLRSKSVGDILDAPADHEHEEILKQKLERLGTNDTVPDEPMNDSEAISSAISRHDQYHGLARQGTKQNW